MLQRPVRVAMQGLKVGGVGVFLRFKPHLGLIPAFVFSKSVMIRHLVHKLRIVIVADTFESLLTLRTIVSTC